MVGGFSFCGVDIADIGLEYAPENAETFVYKPADWKPFEQNPETHHGGYYYGEAAEPKEFTLRCFYEEKHMEHGIMSRVFQLFRRGRTGKLVFKRRPWCWYIATVSEKPDVSEMSNYMNGFVTVHLKAYYPFARSDVTLLNPSAEYALDMLANTALFQHAEETTQQAFAAPIDTTQKILIHNAGTERIPIAIAISGTAPAVNIVNNTTGETVKFIGLTDFGTGYYLLCDGFNGKTIITNGTNSRYGYMYHDGGFLTLESGYPIDRNVPCIFEGNTVTIPRGIKHDVVGRYIYQDGWHKITAQPDENTLTIADSLEDTEDTADITTMNEIEIVPLGSCELTRLEFIYKPTYS